MKSTAETSFIISTQETLLLQTDEPNQPRIKNLKTKTFFLVRILLVLIAGFFILYSIYSKNRKEPERNSPYLSGLPRFYCHLTPHPTLCHDSMSSLTNATALESDPALIFALPLQLVASELSRVNVSITRALSLHASDTSDLGPRLTTCQTSIRDSLSRLGRSLGLLRVDFLFESTESYAEEQNITDEMIAVEKNSGGCLVALGDGVGVEEVKLGVEKASMLLVNFVSIFEGRDRILDDFDFDNRYNPLYSSYYMYSDDYVYGFDYVFVVCLFCSMYLFLALLYFLFWQ